MPILTKKAEELFIADSSWDIVLIERKSVKIFPNSSIKRKIDEAVKTNSAEDYRLLRYWPLTKSYLIIPPWNVNSKRYNQALAKGDISKDCSLDDFVNDPTKRISGVPRPKRSVLLYDHVESGATMDHSMKSLEKMGYDLAHVWFTLSQRQLNPRFYPALSLQEIIKAYNDSFI